MGVLLLTRSLITVPVPEILYEYHYYEAISSVLVTQPISFSVGFLTILVVIAIYSPTILQLCFRKRKDFLASRGDNTTLKALVDGSTADVKEVFGEHKISSSLAQLQKLDLPRERRRRINRKIVICLAAGQSRAFARLKKLARQETAQQIIEDFTHSPSSCMGKIKDTAEDLKASMTEKYQAMSFTCSTGKGCCGHCRYQR